VRAKRRGERERDAIKEAENYERTVIDSGNLLLREKELSIQLV